MEKLFVSNPPNLGGFPLKYLPNSVIAVLIEANFRVVARMDDRRIWWEYSGIEIGEGTPERPDWGMENYSLMLEAGEFGMHIMKHILRFNRLPYSGVVYSGKVPTDARFMKQLLANCIYPNSHVTVDEEGLSEQIRFRLEEIFDAPIEVNCNWLPVRRQIDIMAKHSDQDWATIRLPESESLLETAITRLQNTFSQ